MRNEKRPRGADACRRVRAGRGPIGDSSISDARMLVIVQALMAGAWIALRIIAHVMTALGVG